MESTTTNQVVKSVKSAFTIINAKHGVAIPELTAKYTNGIPAKDLTEALAKETLTKLKADYPELTTDDFTASNLAPTNNTTNNVKGDITMAKAQVDELDSALSAPQGGEAEWETVTGGAYMKATAMVLNAPLIATFIELKESAKYPGTFMLEMKDEKGASFTLAPAGSLRYDAKAGLFEAGETYRITRIMSKEVHGKNKFKVDKMKSAKAKI